MDPMSDKPGPRIGAAYDGEYYNYLIFNGSLPPLGSVFDDINTGVFLIKPGELQLNFLYDKIIFSLWTNDMTKEKYFVIVVTYCSTLGTDHD